VTSEMKLF